MPRPGSPAWVSTATCIVDDCERPSRKATPWYCDLHRTRLARHGTPDGGPRTLPLKQRFWSQVDDSGDCWTWTGPRHSDGYGLLGSRYAHRVSYELAVGEIPAGLHVLHSCDNPPCVRPAHLRVGTQADNMADAVARRRFPRNTASGAKLTPEQVREIRQRHANGERVVDLAGAFGIAENTASAVIRGKSWRWVA